MFKILKSQSFINLKSLRCFCSSQLPKITLPKNLEEDGLKNLSKRFRQKRDQLYRGQLFIKGFRKIPIITSKSKPYLNHFYNQRYRKGGKIILASEGWKRGSKYNNDIINFMAFEENHIYKKKFSNEKKKIDEAVRVSFKSLGIRPELCKNLQELYQVYEPNQVQVTTIPKIMSGINVKCCFETGTGKTAAYALPLIELLLREKENEQTKIDQNESSSHLKEPKLLLIVPSRELGYQISEVFKGLSKGFKIGIATILGGKPLHLKHSGYDIVVTTLGMFESNLKKDMYSLNKVKHLVIDEVDTMCDSSFKKELSNLLNEFSFVNRDHQNACQLILVSATFPQYVYDVIGDFIDLNNIDVAMSKNVNHLLFNVRHTFYRIQVESKVQRLLNLCYKFERDNGQTMIFVNRQPAAKFIEKVLNENDLDCVKFVKGNSDKRFHNFLDFQNGQVKFLVSTDLGSRGLDTKNVQHIINFDCPRFVSDYIHRAGRTGRTNNNLQNCSVHTFVSYKPDVYMLNKLERSIREGKEIEDIGLDIKNYYKTKYANEEDDYVSDEEFAKSD